MTCTMDEIVAAAKADVYKRQRRNSGTLRAHSGGDFRISKGYMGRNAAPRRVLSRKVHLSYGCL